MTSHISHMHILFFWIHCLLHRYVFDNQWHSLHEALDILKIRLRNSNLAAVLCRRQTSASIRQFITALILFLQLWNFLLNFTPKGVEPPTQTAYICEYRLHDYRNGFEMRVRVVTEWDLKSLAQVRILSMSRFVLEYVMLCSWSHTNEDKMKSLGLCPRRFESCRCRVLFLAMSCCAPDHTQTKIRLAHTRASIVWW